MSKKELRSLSLKSEYNTEEDNIIQDLYRPCLELSNKYDRAVGYFRANIYRELGEDLLNFVINGGKIRIVCSPDIPELDEMAARDGYNLRGLRSLDELESNLIYSLSIMAKDPRESDCLDMLRLLIERGSLDLFIAVRSGGIYHRKIGVFYDTNGDFVVFAGSGNETYHAINSIENWGNDEEFDIYRSWVNDFELSKAKKKIHYLQLLFNGGTKNTRVRPLNEIERDILKQFRNHSSLEDCRLGAKMRLPAMNSADNELSPRYFQYEAINAWEAANRVGILSMATGTGKTITALFAASNLLKDGRLVLILVPSKILLNQWYQAIRGLYPDIPILLAGGNNNWRRNNLKDVFTSEISLPRIILATMGTASTNDFLEFFSQAKNPILIADEVHRLGSPNNRRILSVIDFKEKLGLSATPERLFDPEGDEILKNTFGAVPVFDLPLGGMVNLSKEKKVPVLGTFLCRYDYDFEVIHLTKEEQKDWDEITTQIHRIFSIESSKIKALSKEQSLFSKNIRLKSLLIKRSRILKNAEEKINCARRVISSRYPQEGRWIIYCDNGMQLEKVARTLVDNNSFINLLTYHSKMDSFSKEAALKYIENRPGIIVSIRCLDEGVDIPSVDGALILASSTNPREYIQRRGRVLRKAVNKRKATIIDSIVLPNSSFANDNDPAPMIQSELARAYEFASHADNVDVTHRLWKLCQEYNVDLNHDSGLSFLC